MLRKAIAASLRWVTGWNLIDLPDIQKNTVIVYNHTSYFDFAFIFLMFDAPFFNRSLILGGPTFFNSCLRPLSGFLNIRRVGSINEKNGFLQQLVDEMNEKQDAVLVISPEGTTKKAPWKKGYNVIARLTDSDIRTLNIDTKHKLLSISRPFKPVEDEKLDELEKKLKEEMSKHVPVNISNTDIHYPNDFNMAVDIGRVLDLVGISLCAYNIFTGPIVFSTLATLVSYSGEYPHERSLISALSCVFLSWSFTVHHFCILIALFLIRFTEGIHHKSEFISLLTNLLMLSVASGGCQKQ